MTKIHAFLFILQTRWNFPLLLQLPKCWLILDVLINPNIFVSLFTYTHYIKRKRNGSYLSRLERQLNPSFFLLLIHINHIWVNSSSTPTAFREDTILYFLYIPYIHSVSPQIHARVSRWCALYYLWIPNPFSHTGPTAPKKKH